MPRKKKAPLKKRKGGRPAFAVTPEIIAKVESLAARGMTSEQIADCLGISYQTLNEKSKIYAEFSDAIKQGKAKGIANVTAALLKNVGTGNVAAQIFYLKCQAKWRELELEKKEEEKLSDEDFEKKFNDLPLESRMKALKNVIEEMKALGVNDGRTKPAKTR